ncbi:MAG: carbamoyltransferase HypF [Candidatus Aminicenantes bacterium]|nr:carbamoyltransferase HypF [Candidatus Aminicenantes bacterium]
MKGRALRLTVFGVVQGVGFRPFIYRLALKHGLSGWVKNAATGVEIHLETREPSGFAGFLEALERDKPPLARIEKVAERRTAFEGFKGFEVKPSQGGESFVFISPDISTCANCRRDIADPGDRRFRYPFTNCTDCGPRYTIVKKLPYDRPNTTMAAFRMCPDCSAEYHDPLDRRYHAQPIACPRCGPSISLREAGTGRSVPGGIDAAVRLIKKGKILAVKGIGGFHLVCDPLRPSAVDRLRKIKERRTKPLALMALDVKTVGRYARLAPVERQWLLSERRPIVLLKKKLDIAGIAPNLDEIGFMLPYTPLHYLLLEDLKLIVATSSNPKDSPIMKEDDESRDEPSRRKRTPGQSPGPRPPGIERLCDFVLGHDRPIEMRADDSVVKIVRNSPLFVRRARGYVPYPQKVPDALRAAESVLALGGELKDTVSVYKNGYVVTSQFLGDLDDYRNHLYFEETVRHLKKLFDVKPVCVVSDMHPDFHTTRYARKLGLPHLRVQHHHAHVLAALLEHGLPLGTKVLGVAWDGYGYGADGSAWGGEFLLADHFGFERFAHFEPVPLPGGDAAAKQPWRMAAAYLRQAGIAPLPRVGTLKNVEEKKIRGVREMMDRGIRSPLSTSCGRLFDAVAALTGIAPFENEFEAEAAMRLEAAASPPARSSYPYLMTASDEPHRVSFGETIRAVLADVRRGLPASRIAAKFQATLARLIVEVSQRARDKHGITTVVLCGGVFLNKKLLSQTSRALTDKGIKVLRPLYYSPNDESLSVGQIAYALAYLRSGRGFNP